MAQRQTIFRALRWDVGIIGIVAISVLLYRVIQDPFFQPASSPTSEGSRPPDRTEGDILLLLPDSPSADATSFEELDCSYGWFNSLWQEYGSFATALTRNLSPEILAGRSVVIVPKRVASVMPANGISALTSFVRQGGQVILEQPPSGWESLTGIAVSTKARQAQRITSSEGLGVHGHMRKHLPNIPLTGSLQTTPKQPNYPKGPTLLEIDGQPGYTVNAINKGRVYTSLFNVGCTIVAMQQGLPKKGMQFTPPKASKPMTSADRVAEKRLRQSKVPYADLLERAIYAQLSTHRPIPKLWMYPGKLAGALLITHPAPSNIRAAIGFADWSRRQKGTSTILAASDKLTPTHIELIKQTNAELGLLWVRGVHRPKTQRMVGIGALQPLALELDLKTQWETLQFLLPAKESVRLSYVEGALWHPDWSHTFGQLANTNIRLDHSFGPVERDDYGYLFGSGFPFYPIDKRGLPIPMLELPYVLHESSLSLERLKRFLINSQAYFHQPIALNLPAHAMRTRPNAGILLALREAHTLARQYKHWIATLGEFLDFLSARRQSVLTSQWLLSKRRLTISVNILGTRSRTIKEGAFPGVAFPRTFKGQEVERVTLDNKNVPLKRIATSGTSFDRIMQVGPGRHTIQVFYKNPSISNDLPKKTQ